MRITHVTIEQVGRFREKVNVRLNGSLISVVGPNEAGKTTLLEAIAALDDETPFSPERGTRDVDNAEPRIEAHFTLDEHDVDALRHIRDGASVERCSFTKDLAGFWVEMEPKPGHDLEPRQSLDGRIRRLRSNAVLTQAARNSKLQLQSSHLDQTAKWAKSDKVPLPETFFQQTRQFSTSARQAVNQLPDAEGRTEVEEFMEFLEELMTHERDTPERQCASILMERRPRALLFSEEQRSLRSRYDLASIAETPPDPLRNLSRLANLDLRKLAAADAADNRPRVRTLYDNASSRLADVFSEAWVREEVVPVLDVDAGQLQIHVRTPGGEDLSRFDERSEGFRWFVALVAFVRGQEEHAARPLLLIDEAETHLSYDAQARLTAMLARQELAQLVLYTTHSAGCLPPDLGTGIRVVIPEQTGERSRIENGYWTRGPGYTPLMLAMGANAMAFTPARRVVVGEGASESILLPSLLREATEKETLAFQIAPGLSSISSADVGEVMSMAGEVAYLVDGDGAGDGRRRWLTEVGFPAERILSYNDVSAKKGLTLEDLVDPKTFVRAVNDELHRWQNATELLAHSELPDVGRTAWIAAWCKQRGLEPPAKPTLAQRIVDMRTEGHNLTFGRRRAMLRKLEGRLLRALNVE